MYSNKPKERIIIFALSGLGDALMATPAITELRKQFPLAQIDVATMFRAVYEMFLSNEDVSNAYYWDFLKQSPFSSLRYLFHLRTNQYTHSFSVYPSNRREYNIISFIVGAKKRFGHIYENQKFSSLQWLQTNSLKESENIHNVEENINLVQLATQTKSESISKLTFNTTYFDIEKTSKWLNSVHLVAGSYFCVHAGSATLKNQSNKRWGFEKYADLANKLYQKYYLKTVLLGGPDELELNNKIHFLSTESTIVAPIFPISTTAEILKNSRATISNDSALMHIAASQGVPVVAVFGYTKYYQLYPWQTDYEVVRLDLECSPCFYNSPEPASCKWVGDEEFKCIKTLGVNKVFDACIRIVDKLEK